MYQFLKMLNEIQKNGKCEGKMPNLCCLKFSGGINKQKMLVVHFPETDQKCPKSVDLTEGTKWQCL